MFPPSSVAALVPCFWALPSSSSLGMLRTKAYWGKAWSPICVFLLLVFRLLSRYLPDSWPPRRGVLFMKHRKCGQSSHHHEPPHFLVALARNSFLLAWATIWTKHPYAIVDPCDGKQVYGTRSINEDQDVGDKNKSMSTTGQCRHSMRSRQNLVTSFLITWHTVVCSRKEKGREPGWDRETCVDDVRKTCGADRAAIRTRDLLLHPWMNLHFGGRRPIH
jgi:hypothetical protein